jgi:hypothetical protein
MRCVAAVEDKDKVWAVQGDQMRVQSDVALSPPPLENFVFSAMRPGDSILWVIKTLLTNVPDDRPNIERLHQLLGVSSSYYLWNWPRELATMLLEV